MGLARRRWRRLAIQRKIISKWYHNQFWGTNAFLRYAFPLIRSIYPKLITNSLISVQPMAPISSTYYLNRIHEKQLLIIIRKLKMMRVLYSPFLQR